MLGIIGSACILSISTIPLKYIINRVSILQTYLDETVLMRYNSTLVLFESILIFLLFLKAQNSLFEKNKVIIQMISFFSPLTFGVYLIHDNTPLRETLWESVRYLIYYLKINDAILPLSFCAFSSVIFIVCALIDYPRFLIFNYIYRSKTVSGILKRVDRELFNL